MTNAYRVPGPTTVKVGTAALDALEELGYGRNGVDIRLTVFHADCKSDDNGGDQGPPGDKIYLGETATVRIELAKFDAAVMAKIKTRLKAGTAGTPGTVGTLMVGGSKYVRLTLVNTNDSYNFPCAIGVREITIPVGATQQIIGFEFECLKDSNGVLYNTTTT